MFCGDAARATVLMVSIAVLIVPEQGIGVQLRSLPYYQLWHVRAGMSKLSRIFPYLPPQVNLFQICDKLAGSSLSCTACYRDYPGTASPAPQLPLVLLSR
jgi:hypothetical protein